MRLSATLLVLALLGVLAGGWLIGRLGAGLCMIAVSVAVAAWALSRDDGTGAQPRVHEAPTLHQVLERARRSG
jgi:predicted PurR-regulated permease PerM